jgi:hypothetical protein
MVRVLETRLDTGRNSPGATIAAIVVTQRISQLSRTKIGTPTSAIQPTYWTLRPRRMRRWQGTVPDQAGAL